MPLKPSVFQALLENARRRGVSAVVAHFLPSNFRVRRLCEGAAMRIEEGGPQCESTATLLLNHCMEAAC